MKYIGSAFKYVFKNFIFIFLFAIIPSYFLAMSVDIENFSAVSNVFFNGQTNLDFVQLFTLFSPLNAQRWPFALIFFAACAVCVPLLLGFVEKHMRIGSRSFKGLAGRFNTNFLSSLVLLSAFAVVYELWSLLTAGLIYAVILLLDGLACFIVAVAAFIGMSALMAYVVSLVLLWLPCMQITGYSFMDALSYCNQLYAPKGGRIFLAVFLPLLASMALQLASVAVSMVQELHVPIFILLELIYLLLFLYYFVLMYVVYCDTAGEERMDLKKRY